jgi:hypothetical protein
MTPLHPLVAQQHADDLRRLVEQDRLRRQATRELDEPPSPSHAHRRCNAGRSLVNRMRRDRRGRAAATAMR